MTTSDARKRNAEAAQDSYPFTREWLRWVDESQHYTPAHPLNLTPIDQGNPMTAKDRHDELVALLTEIRDRLPEPEGVNAALDWLDEPAPVPRPEPAPDDDLPGEPVEPGDLRAADSEQSQAWMRLIRHPVARGVRREGRSYIDALLERLTELEKAEADRDGWKAKYAAFREDVERGAHYWNSYESSGKHTQNVARAAGYDLTAYLDRDDARTPQPDARPETCCGVCPPIAGGGYDCTCEGNPRAEKAEAERDHFRGACNSWQSAAQEAEYLSEKFRAERDEWRSKFEQTDNLLSRTRDERDKYATEAERWEHRHAALREDVEALRRNPKSLTDVLMRAADILDSDDARDPQADPDTVTLRRDDSDLEVEINSEKGKPSSCIVRHRGMTIFHGVSLDAIVTDRPLRAALGWGDSDDT